MWVYVYRIRSYGYYIDLEDAASKTCHQSKGCGSHVHVHGDGIIMFISKNVSFYRQKT